MELQPLRIGTLAKKANVGVETIRYYQRRGLLSEPGKPLGGQRNYPPEAVERLQFIKRAQRLGLTLDDIAALLKLNDGTGHVRARQLATRRLEEIEAKLSDLTAMRDVLKKLVHQCEHAAGRVPCPIIRAVAGPKD
jgi:MerR family mercuric resistance operon transcriptional regulator